MTMDYNGFNVGAMTGMMKALLEITGIRVMLHVTGPDTAINYLINQGRGVNVRKEPLPFPDFKLEFFLTPTKEDLDCVRTRFDSRKVSGIRQLLDMTDSAFMTMLRSGVGERMAREPSEDGHIEQWRREHWGSPTDTEGVQIDQRFEHAEITFKIAQPPLLVLQRLSLDFPELSFDARIAEKSSVHDSSVVTFNRYVFTRGQLEEKAVLLPEL